MKYFLQVLNAEMKKQHKIYFFNKSIYVSLFLWPMLIFTTAYYSYKPFQIGKIMKSVGYITEENLIIFVLVGYLCLQFFRCFVQSAWVFSSERTTGTMELIFITPANRFAIMAGNAVSSLFESVWLFVVFAFGIIFLNTSKLHINIGSAIVGILMFTILAMLWGIMLNAVFMITRDAGFLFTILEEPMEIFAGIKVPVTIFPIWAKVISAIFPLSYSAEIMRRVFLSNISLSDMKGFLGISVGLGVIMLGITLLSLKLGENYAKKTGNMALF